MQNFFNFKKIRFHRLAKLEQIFCSLTSQAKKSEYAVSIFATDQAYFFEEREEDALASTKRKINRNPTNEELVLCRI